MSNSGLSVYIGADVTDLNAKMVLAKAALSDVTANLKVQAAQMRELSGAARAEALPAFQALAAQQSDLQRGIAGLTAEMKKSQSAHAEMGSAMGSNRMAMMEVGHSARAMADGLAAGMPPMRLMAMEAPRLIQALTELGPGAMAAIVSPAGLATGAVVALTGGLAYLGFEAVTTARGVRELQGIAQFNNLDASKEQIRSWIDQVQGMGGTSKAETEDVIANFMQMKTATAPLVASLNDMLEKYADSMHLKVPEASKKLAEAFGDPIERGEAFLTSIHAGRDAIEAFSAAASKGDGTAALKVMLESLATQIDKNTSVTETQIGKDRQAVYAVYGLSTAYGAAAAGAKLFNEALKGIDAAAAAKRAGDIAGAVSAADAAPKTGPSIQAVETQIEQIRAAWTGSQADLIRLEQETWQKRLAIGDLAGSQLAAVNRAIALTQIALNRQVGEDAIETARSQVEAIAANTTMSHAQQLAAEANVWKQLLDGDKLTAQQRVAVQRDLDRDKAQSAEAGAREAKEATEKTYRAQIEAMQAEAEAYAAGSQERIAILQKEVDLAAQKFGKQSEEYANRLKEMTSAQREAVAQREQVSEEETSKFIRDKDEELRSALEHFRAQVEQRQITAAEALQLENDLTKKIEAENLARLDATIAGLDKGTKAYRDAMDQRAQIVTQANAQILKNTDTTADQEAKKQEQTDQAMARSGAQTITGLITGRQNLLSAVSSLAERGLEKVIEAGLKEVLESIGFESMKTAGATAGAAATLEAKTTAAAAGKAIDATTGSASVIGDAHKAFAGAYSAVAGIPIIGPVLAPAAGAAAFAAVMAYDVFSAEGGFDIPAGLNPIVQTHAQEMILPAPYANVIREMANSSDDQGGVASGGMSYADHSSYTINVNGGGNGAALVTNITNAVRTLQKGQAQRFANTIQNKIR